MNFTIQYQENPKQHAPDSLSFAGNLTIHNIQQIKQEVEQKLQKRKPLHVLVGNVVQLDLSFLQLLMALKKMHEKNSIPFAVQMELSQEIEQLLINSGFHDFISTNA